MIFDILKKIKKYGLKRSLKIIVGHFYGIFYLYEIDLNNFDEEALKKYDYFLKEINEDILKKLSFEKEIKDWKIKILKDRIKNYKETLNYVVLSNDDIVGHFCIAIKNTQKNPYIPKKLKVEEKTSYYFDDYTLEKFRKKGVQTYSLLKRCQISKRLGFKKAIILTYDFNKGAQKAIEKSGMKKVCKVYEIKILRKKILIYGRRIEK